jgi:hypothetical protein
MANRFKLTIKHIGAINAVESQVEMRFRVTLFWNDRTPSSKFPGLLLFLPNERRILQMEGRRKARLDDDQLDVPQVKILNMCWPEILHPPEVNLLNEEGTRLLRWTCEFRATLQQDIDAKLFPYDEFDLCIDLGISVYKEVGTAWDDKDGVVVGKATTDDNDKKGTSPYGAVEINVKIPGFLKKDLLMSIEEVDDSGRVIGGHFMRCRVPVRRQHAYFNQNILLPLFPLHICAILALVLPIEDFGGRSSVLLAVAFLEIGLRLSLDSRLPEVAASILIQKMVNVLFYTLLILTAESGVLYFLLVRTLGICDENPRPEDNCEESNLDHGARVTAHVIDGVFALFALCPLAWVAWKMFEADEALKAWEEKSPRPASTPPPIITAQTALTKGGEQ